MKLSEETKTILKKQWKVTRLPILLALVWTVTSLFLTEVNKRSFLSSIKDFIAALFFVMWFVGQYLRTSKEVRDSSNYSNIQTGIAELQRAISRLQNFSPQSSRPPISAENNSLFVEAKNAVDNGFVLAGLMQAGVAFEQAILSKADRLQIPRENRTTIARVLNSLKDYYSAGTISELFAIWKLRNQLIHLTEEAAAELKNSPKLIQYFEWAIKELEQD
jgi:hypothetical protein